MRMIIVNIECEIIAFMLLVILLLVILKGSGATKKYLY